MVDPNELWIGEQLRSIKSGNTGTFEGVHDNGKLRVRMGSKIILISASKLEIYTPTKEEKLLPEEHPSNEVSSLVLPEKSIDLHIEILNSNLKNARPERILDFQLKAFEHYLVDCKQARYFSCKIIHGKGTGVLKESIHSILKTESQVLHYHLINEGGATEVFFKY